MIKLIIYEDDNDLLDVLCQFLSSTNEISIEGCFTDCSSILTDIRTCNPDIVLMDIDMPEINGIEGVRRIKAVMPQTKVLMFTVFDDDKKIFDAICAGADGYLLKKSPPERIIDALKDLISGGSPMSPSIARKVLNFFPKNNKAETDPLTEKESEVLQQLVNGKSYKQAATNMKITIETVRSHIKNIYRKLHVNSMSQAVVKAINHKLI